MTDYCCPKCGSKAFKRNGFTRHGKQNHRCLECGRQFSLELSVDATQVEIPLYHVTHGSESFHDGNRAPTTG